MRFVILTLVLSCLVVSTANAGPQSVSAVILDDVVRVTVDGELFTDYRYETNEKYPYFYPVNGPSSGISVTTQTTEPYPHHHSLFFGCDRVNGGNYWQDTLERGRIVNDRIEVGEDGDKVVIEQRCEWVRPDAPTPFIDERRIVIAAPSESLRVIDFEITLVAQMDVQIEKTNHSLFSARMAPELSVKSGGTLINAQGDSGEQATLGVESKWMAYAGERLGETEGLAIFDHPKNPWFPAKWFTRDYGFFSPTNMNFLEKPWTFKKGDTISMKYRTVVFADTPEPEMLNQLFDDWVK
ncbi:MAG: PmoA family protein [Candidatus Hinthialibacter antarcticus]|nr:PmoA family protein [Candidatus Hinthialibacter antarcticus]